ncbi:homogentisate phytyltransferase 1, chloroplastic-like [Henckelia pumila]|uniref:homogentisate phytyltransferase 1, chloroplastic-like n=1 Tax=Henckelia pumila TaxID=405737 RepID=UPI003C6E3F2F
MSLLSLSSCFYINIPISTTQTSPLLHTVRANTLAQGRKNITGGFGRNYGEPQPQYHQQRIRNIKTRIRSRHEVVGKYSETDVVNDVVHEKISSSNYKHSFLHDLYLFTRPYVPMGLILCVTSVSTLALSSWTQVSPAFLWEVFKAVVPVVLMSIYVSGINQLYDVEIDKVNKPYLPLASGGISMKLGIVITATCLITSLTWGMRYGSPALMVIHLCAGILGSLYSIELPYMRWKRNPFLVTICMVMTGALATPIFSFIHMQKYVLGKPIVLPSGLIFTSFFLFLFHIVMSLSKDISDVEGDKMHGIKSFSITLGPERIFWMCVSILMAAYGGAMAIGASSPSLLNKIVSVLGHFSLASILMYRTLRVNDMDNFYMFVWKLCYAEYLLVPFMR